MNLNCVICAELLKQSDDVHVTPCGHMFHLTCLLQWLERSKTCPQCRNKCSQRSIHRVYFNVGSLDASRVDVASLQEQLDNSVLQVKEREKELTKCREEIEVLKNGRKKSMKTITGLESELAKKEFLIFSYNEQLKVFKTDSTVLEEQRKEIKELKEKNNLMISVREVLTSTAAEVENMLKEEINVKTLNVWVASLKRELRICESKKTELREILKKAQNNFRREQKSKESLEERILHLESENYRMKNDVLIRNSTESQQRNSTEAQLPNTTDVTKTESSSSSQRNYPIDRLSGILKKFNSSPSIPERVKIIEESNSPYLNIKSSSVGLTHLLKHTDSIRTREENTSINQLGSILRQTSSNISEKYSILKKGRFDDLLRPTSSYTTSSNVSFNGLGGSAKTDDFPGFSSKKLTSEMKQKSSLSERVKNGKLKKLAVASTSGNTQSLENFITRK